MHRLFVALRPPYAMRAQLIGLMGGVQNARWQSDDQLHLTLRFIGEVDGRKADDIALALHAIDRPRPTIALAGAGSFDRRGQVHTLWAGVAADDALKLLHDRVERALARAGVAPDERAYKPHITMARLSRDAGPVEPFVARAAGLTSPPATIDAFILFESSLGSEGAAYHAVARYPLT
ncbi:RNA 2',3'-cyclic phosphodiesterase [Sphingomonas crusticola]|uniref:RNA 2',3'-cyclic phosphodiesterase n=1 Tax=Sphingomonas crusticola TaxID=1697973 RepID=UPI000E226821|nr:RNA 2',3'-cyclic phosphodiesterase [Sphingomonas crusticola]